MKQKEPLKIRVIEHPIEWTDGAIDMFLRSFAGKGLAEFVHAYYTNEDGLYDKLNPSNEPEQKEEETCC